jgi:hypothetical protein
MIPGQTGPTVVGSQTLMAHPHSHPDAAGRADGPTGGRRERDQEHLGCWRGVSWPPRRCSMPIGRRREVSRRISAGGSRARQGAMASLGELHDCSSDTCRWSSIGGPRADGTAATVSPYVEVNSAQDEAVDRHQGTSRSWLIAPCWSCPWSATPGQDGGCSASATGTFPAAGTGSARGSSQPQAQDSTATRGLVPFRSRSMGQPTRELACRCGRLSEPAGERLRSRKPGAYDSSCCAGHSCCDYRRLVLSNCFRGFAGTDIYTIGVSASRSRCKRCLESREGRTICFLDSHGLRVWRGSVCIRHFRRVP